MPVFFGHDKFSNLNGGTNKKRADIKPAPSYQLKIINYFFLNSSTFSFGSLRVQKNQS